MRELRRRSGLLQAGFAARLGISASYLSQIENDERPLTPVLADRLAALFPGDWQDIAADDHDALGRTLRAAVGGAFDGGDGGQVARMVEQYPDLARAFARIAGEAERARRQVAMLDETLGSGNAAGGRLPWEEVRDWFHDADNYVDAIDRAAEVLAAEDGIAPGSGLAPLEAGLARRGVRVAFAADAPLRRMVGGVLTLDASQPGSSLRFQMAWQLASLAMQGEIAGIVADAPLKSEAARHLLTVGLGNYAAGALLMPYEAFRGAARAVRHDIDRLRTRFGTSFEQACHRLSTLQRRGARGVPVFFCRVDMAGNVTKRHSATRLAFARFGGACPLWVVHDAVAIPDRIHVQLAEMPDGVRYVSIAKGLVKPSTAWERLPRRYALTLGCEARHAGDFVYADGLNLGDAGNGASAATPIGSSCRICPRRGCDQRAFPPNDREIAVDPSLREVVPYRIL